ncbi:MAG: 4Fe-4S ferredoxin [Nitrospinota bacterium]|nr:MAG: 4Fe-4S ferredoxin [Nitrospinota bacterium]
MQLGFLIDHRKCIGCHACSIACKEENQVPLGVYRTWVKYVEKGAFPHTRRHFAVLRCNHCANAPCVRICPVTALYYRSDGIVDFDQEACIGCKACMQACPYDALYIDPQTHTAAKCHFCAHRVEVGLKPACEIVCPEQAILSGDLEDPQSLISRLVSREVVQVRKPEQGTRPKLFYIDADEAALTPTAASPANGYLWSEAPADPLAGSDLLEMLATRARTVYNVPHEPVWGGKVALYIWTKSIAAGTFLLGGLLPALGFLPETGLLRWGGSLLAILFLVITGLLLIWDLKRPERFYTILLRPQWKSWLTLGAFIITIYGLVLGLWLLTTLIGLETPRTVFLWMGLLFAVLTAVYTAFLFGQAEGRDLWQNPLLPVHLLLQAVLAGAAALLFLGTLTLSLSGAERSLLGSILGWGLFLNLFLILGELLTSHPNGETAQAIRFITAGPVKLLFWGGVVLGGSLLPLLLLGLIGTTSLIAFLSGVLALAGLLAFEQVWVLAGQSVPLS